MTDNRYSVFKYGTSHKYGATTETSDALVWMIEVDWDGDGVFDGSNEAGYLIKAPTIRRGRRSMLRPSGQGFEPVRTGSAIVVLSNHDGKYDAWNSSSPLYPNVESGKDIRIRVFDRSTGTTYKRFYGIISDITPSGYGTEAIVTLHCDDMLRVLRDTQVLVQRPYPDDTLAPVSIDTCIDTLLDTMQWPDRWGRDIDVSPHTIRYWYSDSNRSVAAEIDDLVLTYFGYWCIDREGRLKFIDKFDAAGQVSQVTIAEEELLKDIGNPQPWTIRRQAVKIVFHVRETATDAIVWQPLESESPIDPGETREYIIEYIHEGYPVFLENFGIENFVVSQSPYEFVGATPGIINIDIVDYGVRAFLSVLNANNEAVYLLPNFSDGTVATGFLGDISWTERTETISSPRNPVASNGNRILVLDSLWYQDKNQAYDMVDQYQVFISALHKSPIVQLENRFAKQFAPDLFDVGEFSIPTLGIDGGLEDKLFRIGGIEDEAVGNSTQAVRTTFYLEPYLQDGLASDIIGHWDFQDWNDCVYGW